MGIDSLIKPRKLYQFDNKHILIIRLDAIGDVLVTTPAVKALRKLYPDSHITACISSRAKQILEGNPYINEIITFDAPWYQCNISWLLRLKKMGEVGKFIGQLREKNFDMVINFRPYFYHYDHLFSCLLRIPRRVGYGMQGGGFLLTDIVPYRQKHIIEQILDIVRYLGEDGTKPTLDFYISNTDRKYAEQLLRNNGVSSDDLIVGLNLCADHPMISELKDFTQITTVLAKVSETLVKKYDARVIFIGSSDFSLLVDNLRDTLPVNSYSMVGKTNLKQLAALMTEFDLLISVDSAPRHLAAAVGIPVIVLNHKDISNIWGPYGNNHYMVNVDVEEVLIIANKILMKHKIG